MNEEIFKPINGVKAQVSNLGRVISAQGNILKPLRVKRKNKSDIMRVYISEKPIIKNICLANTVLMAFKPNSLIKPRVYYIDNDISNCSLENLAWIASDKISPSYETLMRFKLFTSELGVAVYDYISAKNKDLILLLFDIKTSISRKLQSRYGNLCSSDIDEAFQLGLLKFLQKISNGKLKSELSISGLFLKECEWKCLIIASEKSKSVKSSFDGFIDLVNLDSIY